MPFIPHTEEDIQAMLSRIGASSIDDLFDEIPPELRSGQLTGCRTRHGGNGHLPPDAGTRRDGWPFSQFYRRRRLRAPHSGSGLADHHPRRILFRLHALSGRSQPGHAATAVRIPDHDDLADRDGYGQRQPLRRRIRPGRSRADGGARAQELAPRADAENRPPALSPGGRQHRQTSENRAGRAGLRSRTRDYSAARGAGFCCAGHPAAQLLRLPGRGGHHHRLGAQPGRAGHRPGQPADAGAAHAARTVGQQGRRHRGRRRPAAGRTAFQRAAPTSASCAASRRWCARCPVASSAAPSTSMASPASR